MPPRSGNIVVADAVLSALLSARGLSLPFDVQLLGPDLAESMTRIEAQ